MRLTKRLSSILIAVIVSFILLAWLVYQRLPDVKRLVRNVEIVQLSSAKLGVKDVGQGSPAIVLINGVGVPMSAYWALQEVLSQHTRVVAYDRSGVGYSEENEEIKTLDNMDRDLHELLLELNVAPPYILIGHSFGGHIIRYYAQEHLDQVAGLVFLDAPHEDWLNYIRMTWPEDLLEPYFSFWRAENPNITGGTRAEILAYENNNDLVKDYVVDPSIPVLMFTGNNSGHFRKDETGLLVDRQAWADMQASMIDGVKDAEHIIDWEAGHWIHKDKPEMVNSRIVEFWGKIKSGLGESP